jgi:hypothetical protein
MIAFGLILILIGFIVKVATMWIVGLVRSGIGLLLLLIGWTGHTVAGRRYWY